MGRRHSWLIAGPAVLLLAACGSATASPAASSSNGGGTGGTTLKAATVSGHGLVVVAGSNSMTLYQFAQDTPNSGTSACTGSCLGTWPPLTVPAGTTPTLGSGLTGQVGTITRTDGHGTQVTYNGLPVHFFSGDSKPGDANGNYPGWSVVPAGGSAAGGASPSASASSSGGYAYP